MNMEVSNNAEKEASEVLHSLLSVDRRGGDSKENIVVSIPSMATDSSQDFANGDHVQWHTPVISNYTIDNGQVVQQNDFNQQGQQVIWQNHIQIDNETHIVAGETILQELYPIESISSQLTTKEELSEPLVERKPSVKKPPSKKLKRAASSGEEECPESENTNKIEDNHLQVKARLKKGCDCRDSCYRGLIPENVYKHRLNIADLTKSEHDMYLMGVTMACLANPLETTRHKARRRLRASYVYQGRRVCLEAFLYLENVTHYQLKRIRHHVMTHGVAPRVHGNMGKKPYNTFSLDIYKHATEFLKQYLEQHAGCNKDITKTVIVNGDSRRNLFDAYKEYGELLEPGVKLMGYSTFRHFMKYQFPNVKFSLKKPDIKEITPFKSGKCMTYDKNKDPVRIEAEKAKAESRKAAMEARKKEKQNINQQSIQIQQHMEQPTQVVIQQQQMQNVQVSQNQQQVQAIQQVTQHQMVQQMQTIGEDSSSQPIEITQQVIPLTVVQQPQQTYIVTPVSHLQTSVHGAWYSRQ